MTIPKIRVRKKSPKVSTRLLKHRQDTYWFVELVKTKTGCGTCRLRRIKCDEARPYCARCASTGRTCDGYAAGPSSQSNLVILSRRSTEGNYDGCANQLANGRSMGIQNETDAWICSLSSQQPWHLPLLKLSYHEGQAFAFFRQHTAIQLQDGMKSELWGRWAMQFAHHEPNILHAIIAVGAMHHARWDHPGSDFSKLQQVALSNYSKAVVEMQGYISKKGTLAGVDVVLLGCILFAGFEMLQHDIALAMQHLGLGLKILRSKHSNPGDRDQMNASKVVIKSTPTALLDELIPIFVRLDYVSLPIGTLSP